VPTSSGSEPPCTGTRSRLVLAGFAASALALVLAPLSMPEDYSWIADTTSESAAQGVPGAWWARFGFLLFGLSVLACTATAATTWGRLGRILHAWFGTLMVAAAVFSSRSWRPDAAFDGTENALHSIAATAMGVAFAFGVVVVLLAPGDASPWRRTIGIIAVAASVVLPLGMAAWPDASGVLQRTMFGVAYAWYVTEVLHRTRSGHTAPAGDAGGGAHRGTRAGGRRRRWYEESSTDGVR
jgi:hypothetical protein